MLSAAAALVGLGVAVGSTAAHQRSTARTTSRGSTRSGCSVPRSCGWPVSRSPAPIMIGLVPALHGSRIRADDTLRAGGRSTTDGPASRRVRRALVAAEFALATPLLVAAALVLVSLDRLNRVPVGLDTERMLTAAVSLTGRPLRTEDATGPRSGSARWSGSPARARRRSGGAGRQPAAARSRPAQQLRSRGPADAAGQSQPVCPWVGASPEFFKTVGLHARTRAAARRSVAAGRRGRGRSRLGGSILSR